MRNLGPPLDDIFDEVSEELKNVNSETEGLTKQFKESEKNTEVIMSILSNYTP